MFFTSPTHYRSFSPLNRGRPKEVPERQDRVCSDLISINPLPPSLVYIFSRRAYLLFYFISQELREYSKDLFRASLFSHGNLLYTQEESLEARVLRVSIHIIQPNISS
jgi:hypothetical protein